MYLYNFHLYVGFKVKNIQLDKISVFYQYNIYAIILIEICLFSPSSKGHGMYLIYVTVLRRLGQRMLHK